jgi:hypothetical protein
VCNKYGPGIVGPAVQKLLYFVTADLEREKPPAAVFCLFPVPDLAGLVPRVCRSTELSVRPLLPLASVLAAALALLICRGRRPGGVSGRLLKLPASVSTLSLLRRGVGRLALRLFRVGLLNLISAVVPGAAGWTGIFRTRCGRAWSCCFRASPAWSGLQLLAGSVWVPGFTALATPRWLYRPRLLETRPRLALRRPRSLRFADSYACLYHADRPLQWRRPRRQVQCWPPAAAFCRVYSPAIRKRHLARVRLGPRRTARLSGRQRSQDNERPDAMAANRQDLRLLRIDR